MQTATNTGTSSRWSDALLDELRLIGDPLADAAVAELKRDGRAGHDLFAGVEARAAAGGLACAALVHKVSTVPDWVSFPRMRAGCTLSLSHPMATGLSLLAGSLVESYAGALGAKVLVRTGNLERSTRRRIYETGEFLNVLAREYGARPGTRGHRALVNLRLMHALVRAAMQRRSDWDMRWGVPVNQEDYASTLMTFSLVYSRSMRRLGLPVSDAEVDSLHHGWRYAGYVLGIDPRLLTESPAAEQELYDRVTRRHHNPDDDSRALVHALFDTMGWQPPFFLPKPAQQVVARFLVGDALADALRIPHVRALRHAPQLLARYGHAQGAVLKAVPGLPQLYERLGIRFFDAVLRYGLSSRHAAVEHVD